MTQHLDSGMYFEVKFTPGAAGAGMTVLDAFASRIVAAGGSWVQYGNGTTKASGAPGASPFVNSTSGWAQLRLPGSGTLELLIQRAAANEDYSIRMYISHGGFGTGGTASTRPTAVDEQQVIGSGGGYDGSFTWATTNATAYRWDICVDSTPSARGYCFVSLVGRVLATGAQHRRLVIVPLDTVADGTTGSADAAPYVVIGGSGGMPTVNSVSAAGWYKKGLSGEAWDSALVLGGDATFTSRGVNPYTSVYDCQRVSAYKASGNIQHKGECSPRVQWLSTVAGTLDTVNLATPGGAFLHYDGGFLMPWPSGVAPT